MSTKDWLWWAAFVVASVVGGTLWFYAFASLLTR